jgi:hypothetical protein
VGHSELPRTDPAGPIGPTAALRLSDHDARRVMHRNVTHNKCYATVAQFADATLGFLRENVPRNWASLCDSVTDNFCVIRPSDFRVLT